MKDMERLLQRTVGRCELCNKTGFLRSGTDQTSCSCRLKFLSLRRFTQLGIPPDYWDKSFASYTEPDQNSFDTIVRYTVDLDTMFSNGTGLYIHGSFGVGKSGMTLEVLKEVARRRSSDGKLKYTLAFLFWPDVMRKLTSFDEVSPAERAEVQETMKSVDFLCLDDVGREYRAKGSNWVSSNIDAIFRSRMATGAPTILTSNFSPSKIRELYGESLESVFRGSLIEVDVKGNDFRPSIGDKRRKKLLEGIV